MCRAPSLPPIGNFLRCRGNFPRLALLSTPYASHYDDGVNLVNINGIRSVIALLRVGFTMHSVLIVDDHPVIRLAVRILLEKHDMHVVGEADNGLDAVRLVRDLTPQVVILDIGIPKLDGFTTISRIKALNVRSEILILTSQPADSVCRRCIQLGARGFVNKEEDLGSLVTAIKAVDAGYTFFPPLSFDSVHPMEQLTELEQIHQLTDREVTVLQYLAQGYSNKQIGEKLFLSNKTVSTYKTRLLHKLGLPSLVHLADFAKRNALAS